MEIVSSVMARVSSSYTKPSAHVLLPLSSLHWAGYLHLLLLIALSVFGQGETNTYKLPPSRVLNRTWVFAVHSEQCEVLAPTLFQCCDQLSSSCFSCPTTQWQTSWWADETSLTREADVCIRFISWRASAALPTPPSPQPLPGCFRWLGNTLRVLLLHPLIQPLGCNRVKDDSCC